jgi:hypothetical protein
MSNGTLQQLASKGVQDGHLSISPETSFFKRTYKRVSNFACECIDNSVPALSWDKEFVSSVPRNGDLLSELWLCVEVNPIRLAVPGADSVYFTNVLGHAMLRGASLEIGNNQIDTITGLYLEIKWELESDVNIDTNELVLRANNVNQLIAWSNNGNTLNLSATPIIQLYVAFPFYFAKARSQSLPVIALQYHDIRVKFALRKKDELVIYSNPANKTLATGYDGEISNGQLIMNFVYLDSMERRLFASNSHEYLIKNIQISDYNTKAVSAAKVTATVVFNHPVTAVYWVVQKQSNISALEYFNFERTSGLGDDPITSATIKFNGSDREKNRGPLFWRVIQPKLYFARTPRRNVYTYSFAQHPSAWFPSGSVNLSRIDSTQLSFDFPTTDALGNPFGAAELTIIAENFNVIRIQGGMAAKKSNRFGVRTGMDIKIRVFLLQWCGKEIAGFQKYPAQEIRALSWDNPVGPTKAAAAA